MHTDTPLGRVLSEDGTGWFPVHAHPPLPSRLTQRSTPPCRGLEETLTVGSFPEPRLDAPNLALHTHDGEQRADGPDASRSLCTEDDSIAQVGPRAFGLVVHGEIRFMPPSFARNR